MIEWFLWTCMFAAGGAFVLALGVLIVDPEILRHDV